MKKIKECKYKIKKFEDLLFLYNLIQRRKILFRVVGKSYDNLDEYVVYKGIDQTHYLIEDINALSSINFIMIESFDIFFADDIIINKKGKIQFCGYQYYYYSDCHCKYTGILYDPILHDEKIINSIINK